MAKRFKPDPRCAACGQSPCAEWCIYVREGTCVTCRSLKSWHPHPGCATYVPIIDHPPAKRA
jgi:hypothetical protein